MVKVTVGADGKTTLPCELYLNDYEKQCLDDFYYKVSKDWDGIYWVVGGEGDGKSVYDMQRAVYLDPKFSLEKMAFNLRQLEEKIDAAEPFDHITYDEADEGTGVRGRLENLLKRKLKTIRDKNLFISLITPTFFDRGKYFAIHRTEFLIHVYSKNLQRGYFRFFNKERKKKLYIRGKKEWDLGCVRPNFGDEGTTRFTNLPPGFPIDYEEYKKAKHAGLQQGFEEEESPRQAAIRFRRQALLAGSRLLKQKGMFLSHDDLAVVFGVSQPTISADFNVIWSDPGVYEYHRS